MCRSISARLGRPSWHPGWNYSSCLIEAWRGRSRWPLMGSGSVGGRRRCGGVRCRCWWSLGLGWMSDRGSGEVGCGPPVLVVGGWPLALASRGCPQLESSRVPGSRGHYLHRIDFQLQVQAIHLPDRPSSSSNWSGHSHAPPLSAPKSQICLKYSSAASVNSTTGMAPYSPPAASADWPGHSLTNAQASASAPESAFC